MIHPWCIMNFGPVVKPFGSTLKKVRFGQFRLIVVMAQTWLIMKFRPVVKLLGSTFKNVLLGQVITSNGTALVDHELWTRS